MTWKRLTSASLIGLLIASQVSAQSLTSPYAQALADLQRNGVVDSPADGNARLYEAVNRAEALKVIIRAQARFSSDLAHIASSLPAYSTFTDVYQQAWYAPYIEFARQAQLITGYPDGSFRPEVGVQVQEAIAMVVRAFGDDPSKSKFMTSADLPNTQGQWYTGIINIAIARNAIQPGSGLQVGQYMTRGQLFDIVYRMRTVYTQRLAAFPGPVPAASQPSSVAAPRMPVIPASQASAATLQYASTKAFAISIPSIGIADLLITHPADPYSNKGVLAPLQNGVGHLFGYPGDGGKVLIYGHSSGYPWDLSQYTRIFRTINKVAVGERVYITYQGKLHVYQVTSKTTVSAKDKKPYEPDGKGEELILYTCWPPDSITQRYLIHALPVETIALR